MKEYTYSEARQNMAALLEEADRGEMVRIRRKDGRVFELKTVSEGKSPLDVEGVDLGVSTGDIVEIIRDGRSRYGASE